MTKRLDLVGQRFGRLTVTSLNKEITKQKKATYWNCKCDCGNEKIVYGGSLKNGSTTSCGCYNREKLNERAKIKDFTGMKFGRLIVVERCGKDKQRHSLWLCKCECGSEIIVRGDYLRNGDTTSCGCFQREAGRRFKDLTGIKFGRLTVIKCVGKNKQGNYMWLCKCDCGNEVAICGGSLSNGSTTSCGCYHKDKMKEISAKENNSNWKGGITPIRDYLRHLPVVSQWRKDTYIRENNKCQLTGKHVHGGNSDVHHLKAFNTIVLEAHELNNIQIKQQVKDYTEEELHKLEEYVASWHKDTSNAVLLCEEVHKLFHSSYGQGSNTSEQYEEFKQRYLNGEFKDSLGDDFND